jgi:hypothetical protein
MASLTRDSVHHKATVGCCQSGNLDKLQFAAHIGVWQRVSCSRLFVGFKCDRVMVGLPIGLAILALRLAAVEIRKRIVDHQPEDLKNGGAQHESNRTAVINQRATFKER